MKNEIRQQLRAIGWMAGVLFLSIDFVVTVSLLFFLRSIELTQEQVREAAPATFVLVLIITAVFIAGYGIIRYVAIIRPLKRINETLDKIAHGDFSERLSEDEANGSFALLVRNVNRMTDELASSSLMKTDFISNVSHEMKTPLAVINNYGMLLQADVLSDKDRKDYARTITAASRRMSELITNILRLNRLENQQLEAKKERFNLSVQLGECLLGFEDVWEEKRIELDVNIEDDVSITSDSELLELVWNNLLSNAFKFTDAGGTVGVSLHEKGQDVTVKITDTGCGIDDKTGRHIFEKFYQGDTSHATQGNGLGLALAKRVIDLVGGEISVTSSYGEGSAFTVRMKKE